MVRLRNSMSSVEDASHDLTEFSMQSNTPNAPAAALVPAPTAGAALAERAGSPVRRGQRARAGLARARRATRHLASEVGQGTVEYVGLLLLMATLLAAVVGASKSLGGQNAIGKKVVENIDKSIDKTAGNAR